jgi:hypothetical protein
MKSAKNKPTAVKLRNWLVGVTRPPSANPERRGNRRPNDNHGDSDPDGLCNEVQLPFLDRLVSLLKPILNVRAQYFAVTQAMNECAVACPCEMQACAHVLNAEPF